MSMFVGGQSVDVRVSVEEVPSVTYRKCHSCHGMMGLCSERGCFAIIRCHSSREDDDNKTSHKTKPCRVHRTIANRRCLELTCRDCCDFSGARAFLLPKASSTCRDANAIECIFWSTCLITAKHVKNRNFWQTIILSLCQ